MPPSAAIEVGGVGRVALERVGMRGPGEAGASLQVSSAPALGLHAFGTFCVEVAADRGAREATLDVHVENAGDAPAHIDAVVLGFRWSEHGLGSFRFLRHGWQSWSVCDARPLDDAGEPAFPSGDWLRGMYHAYGAPPSDRSGWHESDGLAVVGGASTGPACCLGLLEEGQSFGVVYLRRDGTDLLLEIELVLDAELPPGQRRRLEPVRVELGTDAAALAERHAEAHGRSAGARTDAPFQAGWCSWYHFFHEVTEDDVLRNLEALAAARDRIPIDLVQLDDGYQRAIGDWRETNEKFPRGLAPLAADIRAAGFRAGLWTAPLLATPDSVLFQEHPDWLLRDGAGGFFNGLLHPIWNPKTAVVHTLDATQQPVLAHLARLFGELTAMGFDYHKLDFLFAGAMRAVARDPAVSRAARLRRALLAIRRGCGEGSFVLGCGCPFGPAVGIADGMRIGPDVAPAWGVEPPVVPIAGIEETQPSTRSGVRSIYKRAFLHRRLWLNDPDCLMARLKDTNLSAAEARTLAAAVAGTGGMVVFSDDVPLLAEESVALVGDTLRVSREVDAAARRGGAARALGLIDDEVGTGASAAVAGGGLVTLVNASDAPAERSVDLLACGVGARAPGATRELELDDVHAVEGGTLSATLAPHESALLRVTGAPPLSVFCDFDGTFAVQDVGATLVRRYADDQRPVLWGRFESGEITAWEYNMKILEGIAIPEDELEAFLQTIELDPGARALVGWCEDNALPFRILSDGFDLNLERLRVLTGVYFDYESNHLHYEDGRWRIAPFSPDPDCFCGTGTCKAGRIRAHREANPGAFVAYVGNGRVSDRCASHAADLVFAKDTLAPALDADGVDYVRYETLREVQARLEAELAKRT